MFPHNPHTFPQCSLLLRQIGHWNITCLCKLAATETGFSVLPGVLGEHGYLSVYFLKMSSFYSSMAHIVPLHHWKFSTKLNKKSDLTLHCHLSIFEGVEFLVFTKTENHQSTEESIILVGKWQLYGLYQHWRGISTFYSFSTTGSWLCFSVSFDRWFLEMIDSSLRALFFISGGGNLKGQHFVGTVIPTLIGFYLQSSKVSFFFRGGHSQTSTSIRPRPLYPVLSHQLTSHPLLPHP